MRALVDRFNMILGCPYDGELMGVANRQTDVGDSTVVPVAALASYEGNPVVQENDVLRCSECQKTFLVTEIEDSKYLPVVKLLEV